MGGLADQQRTSIYRILRQRQILQYYQRVKYLGKDHV